MEKMSTKLQATTRATLYEAALESIVNLGYESEIVAKGALVRDTDGNYFRIQISYCTPDKFDLEGERAAYREKLDKAAEAAAKKAAAMEEKARKAEERAAKKAAKED